MCSILNLKVTLLGNGNCYTDVLPFSCRACNSICCNLIFSSQCSHVLSIHDCLLFFLIQTRFLRIMDEKAELLDKIQELEHICQQLSAETETIGIRMTSNFVLEAQRFAGLI